MALLLSIPYLSFPIKKIYRTSGANWRTHLSRKKETKVKVLFLRNHFSTGLLFNQRRKKKFLQKVVKTKYDESRLRVGALPRRNRVFELYFFSTLNRQNLEWKWWPLFYRLSMGWKHSCGKKVVGWWKKNILEAFPKGWIDDWIGWLIWDVVDWSHL